MDNDTGFLKDNIPWKPSIHMPKWAASIWFKITGVHGNIWKMVYKSYDKNITCCSPGAAFETLWNACYPGSWESNDWVFVYDIERCEKPKS
jgi:hypothetical protein